MTNPPCIRLTTIFISLALKADMAVANSSSVIEEHGLLGVLIKILGILIVLGVLFYSIKYFTYPGENDKMHIKRFIIRRRW